jgi:hypothetical protein
VNAPAVTISPVGGERTSNIVLSPAMPAVVIDPNDGVAHVRVISGVAVTAEIDDDTIDTWAQASGAQTVSLGERRVYVRVGRDHVTLAVRWQ